MNELIDEYAGGMPTEQAPTPQTLATQPPTDPSIALRTAVSGVHFVSPPSRRGEM
jgi:hypothetical protein